MKNVSDLPQPCWLRFPDLPDLKCLVIAFDEKKNTLITLSPFGSFVTAINNSFFCDTIKNHAIRGAQWSADCKTWNNFAQ